LNGAIDLLERRVLVDEARDAERNQFRRQLGFRVRRQHHHFRVQLPRAELPHDVAAIHVAQVKIHDQEVRRRSEARGQRLLAVGEIAEFVWLKTTLQCLLQQLAKRRGIVDQHKTGRRHRREWRGRGRCAHR
jgi:hypothetical protein